MPHRSRGRQAVLALFILSVCSVSGTGGQWARQPGERVRNHFGPTVGLVASACRGACGGGCPSSCEATVTYECTAPDSLRRVRTYSCGTHAACREHDDCLDRCRERAARGLDCDAVCHKEAIQRYGFENATSWIGGGGPFGATPITFEYTRDTPQGPEPVFRCPGGSQPACSGGAGRCVTSAGLEVSPVFDRYVGGTGTARVSGFRSGRVCRDGAGVPGVCEEAIDIDVRGDARCEQAGASKPCSWYGFEFDYANASPGVPLVCSTSAADEDFLGGVVKRALTAMPADRSTELGAALGHIQGELGRGRSLTDVLSGIKVTPAGGAPVGGAPPAGAAPGVPPSVPVPTARGHLVVPMYEMADTAAPGSVLVREVRCTQNGSPVVETTFRLHFRGR